ncbi:alpha-tocopherol transfer protein-like [Haematobia irritans]|uniref:alpha-tocopherol transfer protein-like n=1 Tax=Haematobia irritans TaxID=7368 RepID=UPI003F4FE9B0
MLYTDLTVVLFFVIVVNKRIEQFLFIKGPLVFLATLITKQNSVPRYRTLLWRLYKRSLKGVEKTKELIEVNYSIRLKNPHIFANRDPTDKDTENTYAFAHIIPLTELTPTNFHVTVVHFFNPEPKMIHFTEDIKTYIMINDSRFCRPDVLIDGNKGKISDGEVLIVDLDGVTMKFMACCTFRTMMVIFKYLYQAFPDTVKAIHLINCPTYINKILAIIKPFMSKDLYALIICHTEGLDSLYQHVPKDMLPNEYGGRAGELKALANRYRETLMNQRYSKYYKLII